MELGHGDFMRLYLAFELGGTRLAIFCESFSGQVMNVLLLSLG